MSHLNMRFAASLLALLPLVGCGGIDRSDAARTASTTEDLHVAVSKLSLSYDYAHFDTVLPAGVAGGLEVVFVGSPLEGRVVALSRLTGQQIGELPQPPGGFILPFIMHSAGLDKVEILDAGGFPSPVPLILANPSIYQYTYSFSPISGLSATLTRTLSFASATIGCSEDFVTLADGTKLISDAILGGIWIGKPDGTVLPGIVPKTFDSADRIPQLAFCPTMPLTHVGGIPFLFSGSTLPGVSPLAVRDGTLYFYSPCAEGLFSVPVASLFDDRQPFERAADIRLVMPKPADVIAEELLEFTFNPFDSHDRFLYAADALQLRVIRIDLAAKTREVVGDDPALFNFPASLGFLPPIVGVSQLMVVSNQQHRTPLLNDAITQDMLEPPFIVTKVILKP